MRDMTMPYSDFKRLMKRSATPTSRMIQIDFKGYTADDVNCKYCLHFGGKNKGCLVPECCCNEEKQTALDAANIKEEITMSYGDTRISIEPKAPVKDAGAR